MFPSFSYFVYLVRAATSSELKLYAILFFFTICVNAELFSTRL